MAGLCGAGSALGAPLESGISRGQVEQRSYLSYVLETLDGLVADGTDRYGAVESDLLVSSLDVATRRNPTAAQLATADEAWRVERRQRRAPGGANFFHNQSVYRVMLRAGAVADRPEYAAFVASNFDWALDHLVDENGLFWWGYHRHYDVHADARIDDTNFHEMHFWDVPLWDAMWQRNPAVVRRSIESMWERHVVDKSTGQINRHDQPGGLSFISSSASFLDAFGFLAGQLTGVERRRWLERARLVAGYNWERRNQQTDLLAHTPNGGSRWDGLSSATTTPGVYVPALLRAYDFTGDETFHDQALAYLKGWAKYAYDPTSGSFWGSLELDGSPVLGPWSTDSYGQYEPRGLVDLWAPEAFTAQHNLDAAQAYVRAYQRFGDPELLETAEKWAQLIAKSLPATQTLDDTWYASYSENWAPEGTYAEHYGRAIDFFSSMFDATGDLRYLMSARSVAQEAVSALWYEGLFRGHPNKPYYEAIDGVGILLEALIELDAYSEQFALFGDFNDDGIVDVADFHVMRQHWLQSVEPFADGDVTGDGYVSLADFNRFKNDYYRQSPAAPGSLVVPEPEAIGLAWLSGCSPLLFARPLRQRMPS